MEVTHEPQTNIGFEIYFTFRKTELRRDIFMLSYSGWLLTMGMAND
jgi:hypothetical protein